MKLRCVFYQGERICVPQEIFEDMKLSEGQTLCEDQVWQLAKLSVALAVCVLEVQRIASKGALPNNKILKKKLALCCH